MYFTFNYELLTGESKRSKITMRHPNSHIRFISQSIERSRSVSLVRDLRHMKSSGVNRITAPSTATKPKTVKLARHYSSIMLFRAHRLL